MPHAFVTLLPTEVSTTRLDLRGGFGSRHAGSSAAHHPRPTRDGASHPADCGPGPGTEPDPIWVLCGAFAPGRLRAVDGCLGTRRSASPHDQAHHAARSRNFRD